MARLKDYYKADVAPALMKKFSYKSVMQIPKLDKIVINVGAGEAKENPKAIDAIVSDLMKITGQHPMICKAKKSVANFKVREGMNIGVKVTLRGDRMYEFMDRLFNVALPRVRDFRGINPNSFDGRGNYNMGIKEQLIFPEIDYDKIDKVRGMDICFVTDRRDRRGVPRASHAHGRSLCEIRRDYCGQNFYENQAAETCEVLYPLLQPLQDLRPAARLSSQVWDLPYLLPRARLQGRNPGREKGQLVRR